MNKLLFWLRKYGAVRYEIQPDGLYLITAPRAKGQSVTVTEDELLRACVITGCVQLETMPAEKAS